MRGKIKSGYSKKGKFCQCDIINSFNDVLISKTFFRTQKGENSNKYKKMLIEFAWKLLHYCVSVVLVLKDKAIEFALSWYFGEKKLVCPPLNDENRFLSKSAVELAQMIRNRKLTSYKLVDACIKRMIEVNKVLNAVVDGPFKESLDEAKRIDERIASKQISEDEFSEKPFLGVPFTTKDSTAVGGKLQTLGLVARKSTKAKEDAQCVALAKKAGAIILATTNIPEVNRW